MMTVRFGIIGAGMIAGVVAKAIRQVGGVELAGVASRREENASAFAVEHGVTEVFPSWQALLESDQIDAVYVATPTVVREEIAVAAARAGKHVLADKPFASVESLKRITAAAREAGVAFMDGTHFVHHPRTAQVKASLVEEVGEPQAVRTAFFFPFMDRTNIRFNPDKEPSGAVGDMAWYSMRAVVEYLQPQAELTSVSGHVVHDEETGAIVRGSGLITFADGKSSTFDFGYNAGVCLMDLDILGEHGMLRMDDFVLDWKFGFAFENLDHVVGYTKRVEMQSPEEFRFIAADSEKPQTVSMIEGFKALVADASGDALRESIAASEKTQWLLDQYWAAVRN